MSYRIVVPLDGSVLGDRAISWADRLAGVLQAEVELVSVASTASTGLGERSGACVQSRERPFEAAQAELAAASPWFVWAKSVRRTVLEGEPARTIARHAQEIGADLIVMASHGWGGPKRTVLGSVAARIIDQSTVPVIVIRAGTTVPARLPERVLVPLDGSLKSAAVLGAVVPLACRLRWQVTLLSVVRPVPARDQDRTSGTEHSTEALHAADAISFLAPLAERLRHDGIDARVLTLAGEPAPTIAELVRREQFDLVAMSTRGLCHDRWTASHSITREVAGHVGVPLLTVRPVQVPTQAEIEGWLRRAPREADGDGSVAERVELEHKLWDACGAGGMREGVHSVAAKN